MVDEDIELINYCFTNLHKAVGKVLQEDGSRAQTSIALVAMKRALKSLKNKYVIASIVFMAWVTLFNDIDLLYIIECRMDVRSLQREVKLLTEKNERTKLILTDLTTNKNSMEKFARETYFMKKDNEDVYVFKERAD